jgi:L-rhamnose mutarotase
MTIDLKRQRDAEWTRLHTLSQAQLKKLLDEKFARAYNLHQALNRREMFLQKHR